MATLVGGLVLCAACAALAGFADNPRLAPPRSGLGDPLQAPVLVVAYGGAGAGGSSYDGGLGLAYGAAVVFRPGTADHFLPFMDREHFGLVLQAEHADLGPAAYVLSADGIIRRYFGDRNGGSTAVRLFAGLGLGLTRMTEPGTGGRVEDDLSGVLEIGQEWLTNGNLCLVLKAQGRMLLKPHHHHQAWQVVAGAGIPLPF